MRIRIGLFLIAITAIAVGARLLESQSIERPALPPLPPQAQNILVLTPQTPNVRWPLSDLELTKWFSVTAFTYRTLREQEQILAFYQERLPQAGWRDQEFDRSFLTGPPCYADTVGKTYEHKDNPEFGLALFVGMGKARIDIFSGIYEIFGNPSHGTGPCWHDYPDPTAK